MCGGAVKKVFGGGSHKNVEPPTPAVAQSAPSGMGATSSQLSEAETNTGAKGKKKLIINKASVGTGVNL